MRATIRFNRQHALCWLGRKLVQSWSQVSSKLVPRFVSILDYLDANHLAALVVPSQKTFPLSRNSLIKTRIWFRSSPGKTCCNSLNGVPTSLFCRMCLQNFTTRKLRFYPGSLSSVSSPASASLGTHRTALNDWGEWSGKTRALQHIRYSCVGLLIVSYSA